MSKLNILIAMGFLGLTGCPGGGGSHPVADAPVVIPLQLTLQTDKSAAPISEFEYAKALAEILSTGDTDFNLDDYIFCDFQNKTPQTPDQQQLMNDVHNNCTVVDSEPESDGPGGVGATFTITMNQSINQKKGAANCPVAETVTGTMQIKIISQDASKGTTARGPIHIVAKQAALTSQAQLLMGFMSTDMTLDGTLNMLMTPEDVQEKFVSVAAFGSVVTTDKQKIGLQLNAQVLTPNSTTGQLSFLIGMNPGKSSPPIEIAVLAHWGADGTPNVDAATIGGVEVSTADIAQLQKTAFLASLMKDMEMRDCKTRN